VFNYAASDNRRNITGWVTKTALLPLCYGNILQGETRNAYSTDHIKYQDVGRRILQWMLKRSFMKVLPSRCLAKRRGYKYRQPELWELRCSV
jgi:hypothetical protein